MKPRYKKIVLWVLLVMHVLLIFSFSLQDAHESTVISRGLAGSLKSEEQMKQDIADEKNDDGSRKHKDFTAGKMAEKRFSVFEKFLRKTAHFSLFFLLGVLINLLLGVYCIKGILRALSGVLYAGAVGFADETLQIFSTGRAGRISDVLIDMSGAALAAILFLIGGLTYEKIKKKRLKMDS